MQIRGRHGFQPASQLVRQRKDTPAAAAATRSFPHMIQPTAAAPPPVLALSIDHPRLQLQPLGIDVHVFRASQAEPLSRSSMATSLSLGAADLEPEQINDRGDAIVEAPGGAAEPLQAPRFADAVACRV